MHFIIGNDGEQEVAIYRYIGDMIDVLPHAGNETRSSVMSRLLLKRNLALNLEPDPLENVPLLARGIARRWCYAAIFFSCV